VFFSNHRVTPACSLDRVARGWSRRITASANSQMAANRYLHDG
jgi:hypothetical protein